MLSRLLFRVCLFAVVGSATVAYARVPPKKTSAPPPRPNEVKKQGQMVGANGKFGETYTMNSGFNVQILAAHYTLEPTKGYPEIAIEADKKLLVLDLAFKNSTPADNLMGQYSDKFTAVDDKGGLFTSSGLWLESKPHDTNFTSLKPGQGLGQAALHDPLHVTFSIPAKSRIVKIILNEGRKGRSEEVVRFYVAGTTKAEAGEDGDVLNKVAPLPMEAADPADKSGATLRDVGEGKIGVYATSNSVALRLDAFVYSPTEMINGSLPEDGKRWAIATVTIKNLSVHGVTTFDTHDEERTELKDGDGETYKEAYLRKAKRDEQPEIEIKPGEEYTQRIVFAVPKDATAKTLTLTARSGYRWQYDVSSVK